MASFLKLQYCSITSIEKAYDNFKKSPKQRLAKESYLTTRLEALEEQWQIVSETHRKIISEADEEIFENKYFKNGIFEEIKEVYMEYKSDLKEAISKVQPECRPSSNPSISTESKLNVKLPKISIPVFSGHYAEWTTFRDLYVSLIHNNTVLDNVQKMHYLKGHLTGEAEQLLRHVPITAANYLESWSVLNNRYNNKKYLANCLLKRFMNQPTIGSESCCAIKNILDVTNDTLNGLKNLGINVDSWDVIVTYIICSKLDIESRKQWEASINITDELPTLDQLKLFLESRFRSLEFLDANSKPKPNYSNQKPKVMHTVSNRINTEFKQCPFCKKTDHKISNCKEFSSINYDTRHSYVQTTGLCFNCLGPNHSASNCRSTTRCRICKHKHHSLLHPKPSSESQAIDLCRSEPVVEVKPSVSHVTTSIECSPSESNVTTHFSKKSAPNQILLATALVQVKTRDGSFKVLRALLDQGSQASFVTESAVQLLGLKRVPSRSVISGLGGDKSSLASKYTVHIDIQSRHDKIFQIQIRAHVLGSITCLLPSRKVICNHWPELTEITLADPEFHTPNKIDILLGADVYGQLMRDGLIKDPTGLSVAQNTALGWVISGPINQSDDSADHSSFDESHHHITISMHAHVDDNDLLKKFWQIESDSFDTKILTHEEQLCEDFFSRTTERDETGRYIVRLPFREENPKCKYGNSRDIAVKRFGFLEKRFDKNHEIKSRYSEVIHEYMDLGHMELIKGEDPKRTESVYLPHHAVIREDRLTSKVRVVFDASCKGRNGVSLNDSLMIGPKLQQDLRHIVMRWRMHPICLSADIVKMYRQVLVADSDANFQRLVWRDDSEAQIQDYKLLRVTFGTASAPYLAVKALQQVAEDEGKRYPSLAEKIKTDFYVDDLMTGCQTVKEGIKVYKEISRILRKGGFELQKWITNDKELAKKISDKKGEQKENVDIKLDEIVKVLGLSWNKETDSFHYFVKPPIQQFPLTKRKVISDISRLFDPLGWAAPCVIPAKIMIQKLWLAGIDWDEELSDDLLKEWLSYRNELIEIQRFCIPRWAEAKTDDVCMELHGFCDASSTAYAAVVYLRTVDVDDNVHFNLFTAKTKVAPTRQISIPRLELMGAVLLAKLITDVANMLSVNRNKCHGWTDSSVVLAWLSSHPSRWTTFIGNRTSEILSKLENSQWCHVQSAQNPADIASRGCKPTELAENSMWLQGPAWLRGSSIEYKRPKAISTDLEQRQIKAHLTTNVKSEIESLWTKYSSLQKLVRVIAFCRRFLRYKDLKKSNKRFESYLTSAEINEALEVCIKTCQREELNDKKKLQPLSPFLDKRGILRVGGRIESADLADDVKHPIILPYKSNFTHLIVHEAHKKTLHGGTSIMLNHLRSKYWIISAKSLVKAHISKCITCVRHKAMFQNQLMGQLPKSRTTPARPFLHSGVDFAGPINLRISKGRGNRSYKGYICLFVCMATKAIHLEVVSDLTSQSFIASFKRFVARRGYVSDIWSDNGTNFVGASKELHRMVASEKSSVSLEIRDWLSNNSVSWHFIPPHTPNFGGLWEAGVKSTKFHLKRVIGDSTLTYEEMSTVLTQIEACLNSRPLSMLPDDHNDPLPLTPGHFLVGEPLVVVPDRNYEQSNINTLRRWHLTQKMVQDFWRRWSNEYLVQCLQRYKWSKINPEPKVDDIVLVKEDNLPPARWLLGRVVEKHPGMDKFTRVVTVKCNGALIKRPVSKLCVLPTSQ